MQHVKTKFLFSEFQRAHLSTPHIKKATAMSGFLFTEVSKVLTVLSIENTNFILPKDLIKIKNTYTGN